MSEGLGDKIRYKIISEKIKKLPKVRWAAEREYRKDKDEFLKKLRKRMGVFLIVACLLSAAYLLAINASVEDWKIVLLALVLLAFLLIVVIPNYLVGILLRLKLQDTARKQNQKDDWESLKTHAKLEISEKEREDI